MSMQREWDEFQVKLMYMAILIDVTVTLLRVKMGSVVLMNKLHRLMIDTLNNSTILNSFCNW